MNAQQTCQACETGDWRLGHSRHCIRVRGSPATGRYAVYRGPYLVEAGLAYTKAKQLAEELRAVRR